MDMNIFENRDCMDAMHDMDDKSYDLAIVDPPYGINGSTSRLQRLNGGGGKLKNRILNISEISWDSGIPDSQYFSELFRVSKNQIIWGGNYFPLSPTRCIICWDKCQPWENFSQCEIAWTSFDMPAALIRLDNKTGHKIHPTQKPIELYKWILRRFAKEGYRILDTHVGSGSSLMACEELGFKYSGYEINKDYYEKAKSRIKAAQIGLFS